ncbi:MAG TPA: ABC transporter permease subunit [Arsenicitalea sp.]|nr:ABC transporter permease subunit [Arsenicitalea sp.]
MLSLPLLLLIWQVAATVFANRLFPTPIEVAEQIWVLGTTGKLLPDLGKTLARAATAFVISMIIGTALGIAFGRVRLIDRLFSTWVVVGLNLPAIVIAIVLYIWLGLTEYALILAVICNKVPLVITTIREGVRSLSRDYDELGRAYRMPLVRRLRYIFIPQLTPFVLAAARTGLSLVWKIVLVFEVLGSDGGVGFRISVFFQFFDIKSILAYTATFILVVLILEYGIMRPLERRVLQWRTDRT